METTSLKSFATKARKALIDEVNARVKVVLAPASPERVEQPRVVAALEKAVSAAGGGETGRAAVADRVAYTWFNRVIALRFMDANGYTGIGVVSPQAGVEGGQPEILAEAKRGNVDTAIVGSKTRETVTDLLNGTRRSTDPQGEAYALLLAEYCRQWNRAMPFMFEREGDFTELLIPANLLADDSVLNRAFKVLTADVCRDVEVIGWLYQFYISERHDQVFAGFKKNQKAGPAEIPAATQLFTPHWIVRYLVENSLGRLWMLNRPFSRLVDQMEYYIAPVDEETDFLKLAGPEELTIIDPACGSGHMLTYAFDLLYAIYEEEGYAPSDIPGLILSNNLHGTEIDPRAGTLAAFALTMKARQRQRTFFNRRVEPNICVLEPITFTPQEIELLVTPTGDRYKEVAFWNQFRHADTFGSLIRPNMSVLGTLRVHVETIDVETDLLAVDAVSRAKRVIRQSEALSSRYSVVLANPPYMGSGNMDSELSDWIKNNFAAEKQDLYACFVSRGIQLVAEGGAVAMITGDSWMTAKTFEKYRTELLENSAIRSLVHLRDSAYHTDVFGANSAFILMGRPSPRHSCPFIFLDPLSGEGKRQKLLDAARHRDRKWVFMVPPSDFKAVPGAPIAYKLSPTMRHSFVQHDPLSNFLSPKQGIKTGNNDRFLRYWWEVSLNGIGRESRSREAAMETGRRWFPCQKGGPFRRWYGNDEYVINWHKDGYEIRNLRDEVTGRLLSRPQNLEWLFRGGVTWGTVSSGSSSFRICPVSSISESKGAIAYASNEETILAALGLLNSTVSSALLGAISPTVDYGEGAIAKLPFSKDLINRQLASLVSECVAISRQDWSMIETSTGFAANPLMVESRKIRKSLPWLAQTAYDEMERATRSLSEIEGAVNRFVADQYNLSAEVAVDVPVERVSLLGNVAFRYGGGKSLEEYARLATADTLRDLISYSVGCMFGRYSLDEPGLILADQGATSLDYLAKVPEPRFIPDADNVIPIVDGDWFEDDIVARFREFLRVAFGEEYFAENLRFVADSLGVKDLRDYFVKSFYKDHVQRYKKRPIYWLFSSPKGSFNALIYMHRYRPSTVGTVLNEYLREYQAKLKSSLEHHERLAVGGGTPREVAAAQKEADRLRKVLVELDEYERDLYSLASQPISIDLDDGVKVNYPKFGAALKKIPGLEASDE